METINPEYTIPLKIDSKMYFLGKNKISYMAIPGVTRKTANVTAAVVLSIISDELDMSKEVLASKKRQRSIVEARQIFCYIMKHNTIKMSLDEIGSFINKDHATVIHSVKTATNLLSTDAGFIRKFRAVQNRLLQYLETNTIDTNSTIKDYNKNIN